MDKEIKNKIVVVTGGGRGIGRAIAEGFLEEGAKKVVIVDIEENQGNEATAILNQKYGEERAIFFKGDVTTDLDKIYNDILAKCLYVDILVNNAGIVDENSIKRTINVNTVATVEWSMKFLQNMRKDKGGKGGTILNITSIFAYLVTPIAPFYTASKFAIMGFTRTLGHIQTYEVTGVRVIALCPGVTRTEFGKNNQYALEFLSEFSKSFVKSVPIQEKEDVAKAAMEVIKKAKSGSAWNVINAEPIQEVI